MQICFATGTRKENQSTIGLYVRIESDENIFLPYVFIKKQEFQRH